MSERCQFNEIVVVGAGGVASYFMIPFLKTLRNRFAKGDRPPVKLVDADKLETRNLDRQLFQSGDAFDAKAKAESLADFCRQMADYKVSAVKRYVDGSFVVEPKSAVFCFCDNHLARNTLIAAVDTAGVGSFLISGANSTIGAEAWYYEPSWAGTELDPRKRYPEIMTDLTGSPVHSAGCQSAARQREVPQTPVANFMAAAHALLLANFHMFEKNTLDMTTTRPVWPYAFESTGLKTTTKTIGGLL